MKHCKKQSEPPPALAQFCMDHPEGTWDELREERTCYKKIRDTLLSDQSGLCAYCEISLDPENDRQVAHFHPKSDTATAHNWALDWNNLWLACKGGDQRSLANDPSRYLEPVKENRSCDTSKENRILDGQVLSPKDVPDFPRIFQFKVLEDRIEIVPDEAGCQQAGIPVTIAEKTIQEFHLNCDRLAQDRKAYTRSIEQTIGKLRQSQQDPDAALKKLAAHHLSDSNGHWCKFFTLIRWRFGKAAEAHLHAISYQG